MWRLGAADIARVGWQQRSRRLYDLAGQVARARAAAQPSRGKPGAPVEQSFLAPGSGHSVTEGTGQ